MKYLYTNVLYRVRRFELGAWFAHTTVHIPQHAHVHDYKDLAFKYIKLKRHNKAHNDNKMYFISAKFIHKTDYYIFI